jgi:hypothetical protein
MSNTPRTDELVDRTRKDRDAWIKMIDHARQLEGELLVLQFKLNLAASEPALKEKLKPYESRLDGPGDGDKQDAARYRWLRARWDANTDEDLEQHTDAMNADNPDAAIDAALSESRATSSPISTEEKPCS